MSYRSKVAIVYLLGFFVDLINMFIANVAYPAIGQVMRASVSQLAWVSNGYILGLTLVIPLSAWLAQRIGGRRVFLLSLALQQQQAEPRVTVNAERQRVKQAAGTAAGQAEQHHLLRPQLIGVTPGVRAAEQRGEVLRADDKARQHRVVAQVVMHKSRQHRQRQADGQVADEGEHHHGQNTSVQLEVIFCGHRRWLASDGVDEALQHTPMRFDDK